MCPDSSRCCIIRHCGFLVGCGHALGDLALAPQNIDDVIDLLKRPSPWQRRLEPIYESGSPRQANRLARSLRVARTYNKATNPKEKRTALDAWATYTMRVFGACQRSECDTPF